MMMVVRNAQIAELQAGFTRRQARKLLPDLRWRFPRSGLVESDDVLILRLSELIDDARRFGIDQDRDIAAYTALAISLGRDFSSRPGVHGLFSDVSFSPTQRLRHVLDQLMADAS